MAETNRNGKSFRCEQCGYLVRIPKNYTKSRGRCPKCKNVISLKTLGTAKKNVSRISVPDDIHPLIFLTGKHRESLVQYGEDLQKIYTLIRNQYVHREEYEKQKLILKKQVFTPIIEDAARFRDFSWTLRERINLWQLVFTVLPYTYPGKDPEVVFNLYPRYDYAALVCLCYSLSGFDEYKTKLLILKKGVRGERNTPKMKELFMQVLSSDYGEEFETRIKTLHNDTRGISPLAPHGLEREYRQTEEDFNYGFSWAVLNISKPASKH